MKIKPTATLIALAFTTIIFLPTPPLQAAAPPMTNADIITLVQSGVSDTNIIDAINKATPGFDLSPSGLSALASAKVPQTIIAAIKQKTSDAAAAKASSSQPTPAPANDEMQAAINEIKALASQKPPQGGSLTMSKISNEAGVPMVVDGGTKWTWDQNKEITKRVMALNPNDPRCWEAILIMLHNMPFYYTNLESISNNAYRVSEDRGANNEWLRNAAKLAAQFKTSPVVPDQTRRDFEIWQLSAAIKDLRFIQQNPRNPDGTTRQMPPALTNDYRNQKDAGNGLKNLCARWPGYDATALVKSYLSLAKNSDDRKTMLTEFQNTPNTSVASYISSQLTLLDTGIPLGNTTFTAMDGREVNLEKLRGKVVLVHVWSVGPGSITSREHADLLDIYKAYHGKGLEIIGISTAFARNKDLVLAFIKDKKIPWPESFEGKIRRQNTTAKAYGLGLDEGGNSPTMLLIDKNGKAALVPAGQSPEPEIKRLLKQK